MNIEAIARICHEANRALCIAFGDHSQVPWEQAPEWQRTSAINGVRFHHDNPDAPPSSSHEAWMKEKRDTGWKWGPVKDTERKLHPCMVPFRELPREQQAKDYVFAAIVRASTP